MVFSFMEIPFRHETISQMDDKKIKSSELDKIRRGSWRRLNDLCCFGAAAREGYVKTTHRGEIAFQEKKMEVVA